MPPAAGSSTCRVRPRSWFELAQVRPLCEPHPEPLGLGGNEWLEHRFEIAVPADSAVADRDDHVTGRSVRGGDEDLAATFPALGDCLARVEQQVQKDCWRWTGSADTTTVFGALLPQK